LLPSSNNLLIGAIAVASALPKNANLAILAMLAYAGSQVRRTV
jgi:hypothetical protein